MFRLFSGKKNKEVKEVKEDLSRFNGEVYRGIWKVGDKQIVGAYLRDGWNCIATDKGIYKVPKGTKKTQLAKAIVIDNEWYINTSNGLKSLDVDVKSIEFNVEGLQNDYCLQFLREEEI